MGMHSGTTVRIVTILVVEPRCSCRREFKTEIQCRLKMYGGLLHFKPATMDRKSLPCCCVEVWKVGCRLTHPRHLTAVQNYKVILKIAFEEIQIGTLI
ncbi:hypothetical protein AVEN_220091-1 [Araneus ventricosus]|uniref:Uncharacterized protein n=1 Tax=Araneus ventricosus TaxID=182803 RepID=A0A4Y2CRN4_ARAVE|nr:hypothetical protein AVEN_220091-1 [Araneus ventricosus]